MMRPTCDRVMASGDMTVDMKCFLDMRAGAREIQMLHERMDRVWDKLYPGVMDACMYREVEGPAEVSRFTRDSVMPGQGGECVGLGQIVGQCGRHIPSPRAPIGGLFYTGFDVGVPGMGTHRASGGGIKTARMVMRYQRLRRAII